MTEYYRLTGSQILRLIQQGEVTVEEYAKSLLARIKEREHIQAWAYLDPELVLSQARRLDKIPLEKRGPLHGLAVGIKDIALTKGTFISPLPLANNLGSAADASVVIVLRAAGALILGKTATTEFAATTEGGPCTNPHNPNHTPGGSSSGSAAAVADFQVPVALGTQTMGSMIRPGSFNGVYALKPTWGSISWDGLAHFSVSNDTVGFFARCAEDLEVLAGTFRLIDDEPVPESLSVANTKIAFAKTHIWPKAGPGLKAAWEKAISLLSRHGAEVEEIELPEDFSKLKDWNPIILAGEGRAAFLGNYLVSKDQLTKVGVDAVENKTNTTRKTLLESYDGCARLRPVWDEISRKYDAVITPSTVDDAPRGLEYTGDHSFCSMWTMLHAPVLNIPGFAGEHGLPIGLTVVGPRYCDLHVLDMGKRIGKIFGEEGGYISQIA
ncbi:hypothetical protein PHISCL_06421 [Aspergillus sclerotialis]|uniref:Amidase domain-containing protein n=1 Tax=Aspergillus sclerotialis TaxID=2070753 RepID=A0A3A2ZDL8_9EURO|nr:hypothetical protein PHISCL_06421 [Aspergillus sclerotialis]